MTPIIVLVVLLGFGAAALFADAQRTCGAHGRFTTTRQL